MNSSHPRTSSRREFRKCTRQLKKCVKNAKHNKKLIRNVSRNLKTKIRTNTWQIYMRDVA
jgi:hypothetical protein